MTKLHAVESACSTNRGTQAYPEEGKIVDTDVGPAAVFKGAWFRWWPEMQQFARVAIKQGIAWWRSDTGEVHGVNPEPMVRVRIGARQFKPAGWTRKDHVYFGADLIGVIKKSHDNVRGTTTCLTNSAQTSGWQPSWCLEQHLAATSKRMAA